MTLQLKFDQNNQKKLLSLLKWLREIRLIESINISDAKEAEVPDFELSDKEFELMLKASEEVKNGKYIYCATLGFVHRAQVLPFWGRGLAGANAQNLKWCSISHEEVVKNHH
ncbi:MAG TPA: hypothetical protein ENJ95_08605 [Bacteroidetes bacterium]|nr:hypothetical protein [Bacteroidota bacterium]